MTATTAITAALSPCRSWPILQSEKRHEHRSRCTQVRAFRYWIQGYQNFYEPIVEAYFRHAGYTVLAHPAKVGTADIQRIMDALFDGHKRLGPELDGRALQAYLSAARAFSPTSSWSAMAGATWPTEELGRVHRLRPVRPQADDRLFLGPKPELLRWRLPAGGLAGGCAHRGQAVGRLLLQPAARPGAGKPATAYDTQVDLLYLDEIFRTPQLAGTIERQLRYLDAAVAELKQAFQPNQGDTA